MRTWHDGRRLEVERAVPQGSSPRYSIDRYRRCGMCGGAPALTVRPPCPCVGVEGAGCGGALVSGVGIATCPYAIGSTSSIYTVHLDRLLRRRYTAHRGAPRGLWTVRGEPVGVT